MQLLRTFSTVLSFAGIHVKTQFLLILPHESQKQPQNTRSQPPEQWIAPPVVMAYPMNLLAIVVVCRMRIFPQQEPGSLQLKFLQVRVGIWLSPPRFGGGSTNHPISNSQPSFGIQSDFQFDSLPQQITLEQRRQPRPKKRVPRNKIEKAQKNVHAWKRNPTDGILSVQDWTLRANAPEPAFMPLSQQSQDD